MILVLKTGQASAEIQLSRFEFSANERDTAAMKEHSFVLFRKPEQVPDALHGSLPRRGVWVERAGSRTRGVSIEISRGTGWLGDACGGQERV